MIEERDGKRYRVEIEYRSESVGGASVSRDDRFVCLHAAEGWEGDESVPLTPDEAEHLADVLRAFAAEVRAGEPGKRVETEVVPVDPNSTHGKLLALTNDTLKRYDKMSAVDMAKRIPRFLGD